MLILHLENYFILNFFEKGKKWIEHPTGFESVSLPYSRRALPSQSNLILYNRTNVFANFFNPMTSRDWTSLQASVFPATYNNLCLSSSDALSSNPTQSLNIILLLLTIQRYTLDYRCCTFLLQFHLASIL